MAVTGTKLVADARTELNDSAGERWTNTDFLVWINKMRREMSALKPQVFGSGSEVTHTLAAGAKQTVSTAQAYKIHSVDYNVSTGNAISKVLMSAMDSANPAWRAETDTEVANWCPDDVDPLVFWVNPAAAGTDIKLHVLIAPSDLTDLSQNAIPFDQYSPAAVNYLIYCALIKEDEAKAQEKALAHLQMFTQALK